MNRHAQLEKPGLANRPTGWVKRPDINRSNDDDLALAAAKAIECLTTVPLETLNVTARNGRLHLEGTVACSHQVTTLQEVTRHLPGVQGVIDSITINSVPTRAEARAGF